MQNFAYSNDIAFNSPRQTNVWGRFLEYVTDHFLPHSRNNYRPHLLTNRMLALYGMLMVAVKVSVIALTVIGPVDTAFSSAITTENVVKLANISRNENNLPSLKWNDVLARAAQEKADDMLAKGYFSHTSPDGRLPWDFITKHGYNYLTAGENLAEGFIEAEATEQAWMNSPGHRANILNKNFEEIGVGISDGQYQGQRTIFVVQMFGTPIDQPIKILDKPTKVAENNPVVKPQAVPNPVPLAQGSPVPQNLRIAENKSETKVIPSLTIENARILMSEEKVLITVQTSTAAVRVLALFGETALVLDPKEGGVWEGSTLVSRIKDKKVTIQAFDFAGKSITKEIASFAPDLERSIVPNGVVKGDSVNLFGYSLNLKNTESKFYLIFVALILTLLVIAIAVKRHVQHINLIANTSFVTVLAIMFLLK